MARAESGISMFASTIARFVRASRWPGFRERNSSYAVAASAFGAGFGGSVWALVCANTADEFLREWSTKYEKAFADAAGLSSFFVTSAGPAAGELS